MSETRDKILEVARALYEAEGAEGLSMRRVADGVGVSATAIYRHFESKEALVMAICAEEFSIFERYLVRGLRGRGAQERLMLTGDGYLAFAVEHPKAYRAMFMAQHPEFLRLKAEAEAAFSPTFLFLVDRVAECQREGVIGPGDVQEQAAQIWASCHGFTSLLLDGHLGYSEAAWASPEVQARYRRHTTALLEGLRPRPAAS